MNASDNDTYLLSDFLSAGSFLPPTLLWITTWLSIPVGLRNISSKKTWTYRTLILSIMVSTTGILIIKLELQPNSCELAMGLSSFQCIIFTWMMVYMTNLMEITEILPRLFAFIICVCIGILSLISDINLIVDWVLHGNLIENSTQRYIYLNSLSVRLTGTTLLAIRYFYYQIWSNRQPFRLDIFRRNREFTTVEGDSVTDIKEKCVRMKQLVKKINTKIRPETDTNDLRLSLTEQNIGNGKLLLWIQNLADELDSTINLLEDGENDNPFFIADPSFFIMDPSPSEATSSFIAELTTKMLKAKVKLIPMESTDEIKDTSENARILVICSMTSRFECNLGVITDINAIYHPRIVLILLYCHDYANLPSNSNNVHRAKSAFPRMKDVVEMAYQGCIYRCPMNDKALGKIVPKRKWYQIC